VLWLAAGLAVGLLVGLVIAWFRYTVRRRFRRADDIVRKLHLAVLATVAQPTETPLVPVRSAAFQPYRSAINVLLATTYEPCVVLVTGAGADQSIITAAANLARALRMSGGTALIGTVGDRSQTDSVLTAEDAAASMYVDIDGTPTRSDLDRIRDDHHLFLIGNGRSEPAEVQAVGRSSDAVVLVVERGSKIRTSITVLEELDAVGAPMLGALFVRREKRSDRRDLAIRAGSPRQPEPATNGRGEHAAPGTRSGVTTGDAVATVDPNDSLRTDESEDVEPALRSGSDPSAPANERRRQENLAPRRS
jgi:hypothetical protein